jgi:hypothetical protein
MCIISILCFTNRGVSASSVAHEAGLKYSNETRFVGRGSELCGWHILKKVCVATGERGVVDAFACVNSAGGHVAMKMGENVELWKGVVERVVCEGFDRFVAEVYGDCLPTFPIRLFK